MGCKQLQYTHSPISHERRQPEIKFGHLGNVQPLRNAQRWERGDPLCYGALLEGEGGSSDTVT